VVLVRALALVALTALGACAAAAPARDDVPRRIISLIPSLTEDLFAIGAGPSVVGVSQFTDYPKAATMLPVVASFSAVDAEKAVTLHPDVVVGIEAQRAQSDDVRRAGLRTVLLRDDGFDDIFADIEALGLLTGRLDAARSLEDRLRARTTTLVKTVRPHRRAPSVFVVLGVAPIFTVGSGSYIDRMIRLAGGTNAAALRDAYGAYAADALVAAQPDVLVADPAVQLGGVLDRPPWNALRAVRLGHVATIPDPALVERPGPRYNDGLAWLITTLNAVRT
jgi:iron complex transport system substrate-binding protein